MASFLRSASLTGLVVVLSAVALAAQQSSRSTMERADRFVGTWILNVEKSTFEGAAAPKSSIRTFDYERENTILCTAHTVSASGEPSFVHYLITLDGREYEELSRSWSPDRSPTFVSARKVSEDRIDLTFKRAGRIFIWHWWTVSDQGGTLTIRRKSSTAQGKPTSYVMVYEKQQ